MMTQDGEQRLQRDPVREYHRQDDVPKGEQNLIHKYVLDKDHLFPNTRLCVRAPEGAIVYDTGPDLRGNFAVWIRFKNNTTVRKMLRLYVTKTGVPYDLRKDERLIYVGKYNDEPNQNIWFLYQLLEVTPYAPA